MDISTYLHPNLPPIEPDGPPQNLTPPQYQPPSPSPPSPSTPSENQLPTDNLPVSVADAACVHPKGAYTVVSARIYYGRYVAPPWRSRGGLLGRISPCGWGGVMVLLLEVKLNN